MDDRSLVSYQQQNLELTKENEALKQTVSQLLTEIQRLRDIERGPSAAPLESTPEKRIIQLQIESYESMAKMRQLTLEEIRAVDLLIKNQNILNEIKPQEVEDVEVLDDKDMSNLLRIAGNDEQFAEPNKETKRRSKQKTGNKNPVE